MRKQPASSRTSTQETLEVSVVVVKVHELLRHGPFHVVLQHIGHVGVAWLREIHSRGRTCSDKLSRKDVHCTHGKL